MNNFFNSQFWFSQRPGLFVPIFRNFLIGLIAFFIITDITSFVLKTKKKFLSKLWLKIFNFSLANAIIAAFLLFFNYELIPFLSARFWFILWVLGMIIWIVFIVLYAKKLPAKKKEIEQEREYKKYIP
jgi:hypothetical protein